MAGVWDADGDGEEGDADDLYQHSSRIPLGGTVSAEVGGDVAVMRFNWETAGNGPLMMMALPHHLDTLVTPQLGHSVSVFKGLVLNMKINH